MTRAAARRFLLTLEAMGYARSDGKHFELTPAVMELGYAYLEAVDGHAATPVLESAQRIDLLISDVGLPGINGRQLAEIARQARPGLKVLFITGYAEDAALRGGFLDGGMNLVTKPFALDDLAAKVRQMLQSDG